MLWLLVSITLLGFILLFLGVRGRLVGREPRCRKCRFDLTGIDSVSIEAVCPECASKLAEDGAVHTGLRRRRRRPIFIGVLLLMPLIGALVASPSWTAWNASKPTQILLLDGRFGTKIIRDAAVNELVQRQDASELSTREIRSTLGLIARRISRSSPIDLTHAARLKRGRVQSLVNDEDWDAVVAAARELTEAYWISILDEPTNFDDPTLLTVIRDAQGRLIGEEPFPLLIDGSPFAVGSVCFVFRLEHVTVDGEELTLVDHGDWKEKQYPGYDWAQTPRVRYKVSGPQFSIASRVQIEGDPLPDAVLGVVSQWQLENGDWEQIPIAPDAHWLGSLEPGKHRMQATWSLEAYASDEYHRNTRMSQATLDTAIELGEFKLASDGTLNIVDSNLEMLELVRDDARLEQAKKFFEMKAVELRDHEAPPGPVLNILLNDYGVLEGAAMVGHLEVEIGDERFGTEGQYAVSMRPTQGVHQGTGFALSVISRVVIPDDETSCTIIFVPDLDDAVKSAAPWLTEHGTPMPTVAQEIRWENIPITSLVPEDE